MSASAEEKPHDDQDELRRRIAELETQLHSATNEILETQHRRQFTENLTWYGHTDNIIFVHSEELDQGLIYRISKGDGAAATLCRYMVRYNIDQFLQRPTLHQWMQKGKLYREAKALQSSRFELFFDLLFVGLAHQLSEAAAEEPTGLGFAIYVLTFAPAFSVWGDIRDMANQFANDDVTQRAYIIWTMLLLVGYANNASSIHFRVEEGLGNAEGEVDLAFAANLNSLKWAIGFFAVAKLSRAAVLLIYSAFLPLSRRPLIAAAFNPLLMALILFIGIFTPLRATITLAAVGIFADFTVRFFGIVLYKTFEVLGKRYERIRKEKLGLSESSPDPDSGTAAFEDPVLLDVFRTMNNSTTAVDEQPPMSMGDIKMCRELAAREALRIPAINIEHQIERLGAFVTVVLGEMVMSVFFSSSGHVGLNMESGRAMLSLMLAFNLNWLYFDSALTKHFVHAIRRHWISGYFFTFLHLPLCMSLLLASAAVSTLIKSNHIDSEHGGGLKWFFGAGLGVSMCTMATIGTLHRNLDEQELNRARPQDEDPPTQRRWKHTPPRNIPRTTISRKLVILFRYLAGIAMCLLPLADHLSSMQFLCIYVGITALLIVEETIARVEKREKELDG
ncbi:hypothetical protein MIND_01186400 [Mycena indigotica]|uniref:Uncharacterized protein n=1 Tax=Mycena indigotica TaxID=2126181 RepID=A0A8H6VT24_9AGAR|nr:uncharacterized protein MIND_01186400 [Mycena indigotica]KAF7292874.1 hypothetical protein MIND_01186400 [Mycena indigotica]